MSANDITNISELFDQFCHGRDATPSSVNDWEEDRYGVTFPVESEGAEIIISMATEGLLKDDESISMDSDGDDDSASIVAVYQPSQRSVTPAGQTNMGWTHLPSPAPPSPRLDNMNIFHVDEHYLRPCTPPFVFHQAETLPTPPTSPSPLFEPLPSSTRRATTPPHKRKNPASRKTEVIASKGRPSSSKYPHVGGKGKGKSLVTKADITRMRATARKQKIIDARNQREKDEEARRRVALHIGPSGKLSVRQASRYLRCMWGDECALKEKLESPSAVLEHASIRSESNKDGVWFHIAEDPLGPWVCGYQYCHYNAQSYEEAVAHFRGHFARI